MNTPCNGKGYPVICLRISRVFYSLCNPTIAGKALRFPAILQDRTPLATGPFRITAWETGREVRFEPNPYYSGNPPKLDALTVRFPQQPPQQWGGLITSGDCDIILPEPAQMIEWRDWAELQDYGYINLVSSEAPVVLRLDFNVSPAVTLADQSKGSASGFSFLY